LVGAGSVPKTSSGKSQRHACRETFLAGGFESLATWRQPDMPAGEIPPPSVNCAPAPTTEEEVKEFLASLVAAKFGGDDAEIDPDLPIAHYGLDSLQAIELMHAVEDRLGVILPMASFLQSPSVAELVEQAMRQLEAGSLAETKALHATAAGSQALARVMTHPLSHGQQALWLISRMAPESAVYNVTSAARVRGEVDAATMRRAFQTLVNRHAALRTTFKVVEGTPIAFVSDRCEGGFE